MSRIWHAIASCLTPCSEHVETIAQRDAVIVDQGATIYELRAEIADLTAIVAIRTFERDHAIGACRLAEDVAFGVGER